MLIAKIFNLYFDKNNSNNENKSKVFKVFYDLKARFIYRSDTLNWDKLEHWESEKEIPDRGIFYGDCDSFALAIRKYLRREGINDSRLVFCQTETGGYHLIIDWQGWLLDNRYDYPVTRDEIDYKFIKISGFNKGDNWRTVV